MRVLVSGATGFIGRHLIAFLLESEFEVAILRRSNHDIENSAQFKNNIHRITSDSYEDICFGIKKFDPSVVIHLAALYKNNHEAKDISDLITSNITLGTYILESLAEKGGGNFLNVGTRWQHVGNKRYDPVNLYAATKESFKCILKYYERKNVLHKTVELCDTFGHGDTRKKIVDLLISAFTENRSLDLTPGGQVLDLSFVDDICEFIISNIKNIHFFDNKTISLCGTTIKLLDLGKMIENKFNKTGLLRWNIKPYRENEVMKPPIYYRKIQLRTDSLEKYINYRIKKVQRSE
jgi:nucleoside-diphosphate-sugar epimerase